MTAPFPPIDDLLLTVRDFLVSVRGELEGERRYEAQVAAYLLDVTRRELAQPRQASAIGDLSALCTAIRSGGYDDAESELAQRLLNMTEAELQIVRPDLLTQSSQAKS